MSSRLVQNSKSREVSAIPVECNSCPCLPVCREPNERLVIPYLFSIINNDTEREKRENRKTIERERKKSGEKTEDREC